MNPSTKLLRASTEQWRNVRRLVDIAGRMSDPTAERIRKDVGPVAAECLERSREMRTTDKDGKAAHEEFDEVVDSLVKETSDEGKAPALVVGRGRQRHV